MVIGQQKEKTIKLKRVFIEYKLPPALQPLRKIANNLWWSWNKDATDLFRSINPAQWEACENNPIALIDNLSVEGAEKLIADAEFMAKLAKVNQAFQVYLAEKPDEGAPRIAYFSMEYGLHISVRLYSGGLGVLAGDFLKEASDSNARMIAMGLLYRYGYFQQSISLNGDQINNYPAQKFTLLPVTPVRADNGDWLKIEVDMPGRAVYAKVWQLQVGRIPLYLLDTDLDENTWEDRSLTHQLYGGDNEHRLKQEILLGIGGIRALEAMELSADVYHINEGHAAFLGLERLRNLVRKEGLSIDEALEAVRGSALFTTHTPVPAGHDYFPESLLREYLHSYTTSFGLSWSRFMALGKKEPENSQELFSMSHLAIRLSQEVNGVSELHGNVSRRMFSDLYPTYSAEESHIGYVTNSVHYPTWIANDWNQLFVGHFGPEFLKAQSNPAHWAKLATVSDETIADIRMRQKKRLLKYVKSKLQSDLTRRGEKPAAIFEALNQIREEALVIGFARRFATYKRAHLLFSNLERLSTIVNMPGRPVMFIFAGKAHPADRGGQELIKRIVQISQQPEFIGKIIFLEGYNMEMAKLLVRGVDIWLNTPIRPMEASGTSGMKAAMNGVLNFSVLDGWWAEGYRPGAGWALPLENTYEDKRLQDELDAETVYNILETEIVPDFFDRDGKDFSPRWIEHVRETMMRVAPHFTMKRMLDDYFDRFYRKLAERQRRLRQNNFALARKMAAWKAHMRKHWDEIEVMDMEVSDTDNYALSAEEPFGAKIRLFLNGIAPEHVGLEAVFFRRGDGDELEPKLYQELSIIAQDGKTATYQCALNPNMSGVFEYGFRLFAKHPDLPHRQDVELASWL
jgi:starch phosphorylase